MKLRPYQAEDFKAVKKSLKKHDHVIWGKVCSVCGINKSLDEFHKQKSGKFGRRASCKLCRFILEGEKTRIRLEKYRQDDPDKMKAYKRQQYHKHKERKRAAESKRLSDYGKTDIGKDKKRMYAKEYRKTDACKISRANSKNKRKVLKRQGSDGTIPLRNEVVTQTAELQKMLNDQDNKCNLCRCDVSYVLGNLQLDHIHPISKGGLHSITNVQWLCKQCNMNKGVSLV